MWIKTNRGLLNADHEENRVTLAVFCNSGLPKIICHSCVLDKITDAIKNGDNFLEVE